MPERERVQKAIEAPVAEATKLLEESGGADLETRLAMRIDGWGRGLAAGLEELAIAVAELRRSAAPDGPSPTTATRPPTVAGDEGEVEQAEHDARSEDDLRAEAARSREATAALREESEAS
ncbi:MAG TPA: hypothetical protein VLJ44_07530 [Gaiellaceae bacterium]|nr:hypothetical protein [Gaiellaceae bacterium]